MKCKMRISVSLTSFFGDFWARLFSGTFKIFSSPVEIPLFLKEPAGGNTCWPSEIVQVWWWYEYRSTLKYKCWTPPSQYSPRKWWFVFQFCFPDAFWNLQMCLHTSFSLKSEASGRWLRSQIYLDSCFYFYLSSVANWLPCMHKCEELWGRRFT